MKTISEAPTKDGRRRRVVVEVDNGETLLAVRENSHYQLGDPLGDVVASHILEQAAEVSWCSVEQKWVD